MEYFWILSFVPLALIFGMALNESNGKKNKLKVRRLRRKLKKYEKGDNKMSKLINELIGKKCILPVYGPVTVLDADEEWIKFEFQKKGVKTIKIERIDELTEIEISE